MEDAQKALAEQQGKQPKSNDPLGDPVILRMHGDTDMNDELSDYDLVIVHYYNSDLQGSASVQKNKEAYRNAITAFREELQHRIDSGAEGRRRVRFAECDFSLEINHKFLLQPNQIVYPNVVMYLSSAPYPFNPFENENQTPEELTNYLTQAFLKHTNFFVQRISCAEFQEKRAKN